MLRPQTLSSASCYSFGLFTYPLSHGGQMFTVIHYWVKPGES